MRFEGRIGRRILQIGVALVGLNLLWRTVRFGLGFPIWGDEAMLAVNFQQRGMLDMFEPLDYGQIAPLGFLWIELLVTRLLGLTEWGLRSFPYVAGIVSMIMFWQLSRLVLDRREMVLAVGFLSASYYAVRHGVEVKPYSSDLLVALTLLLLVMSLEKDIDSLGKWFFFGVVGSLGVWLSYPSIFVSAGLTAALACKVRRSGSKRAWIGCIVATTVIVGSFLPMMFCFAGMQSVGSPDHQNMSMWSIAFPPAGEPWLLPIWFVKIHTGRMMAYPFGGANGGSTLTFILVSIGCVVFWRRGGRYRWLLMILVSPLALNFVAAVMQKYPYGGTVRTCLYMAPTICLLAGTGLGAVLKTSFQPRKVPAAMRLAAISMGVLILFGIGRDLVKPYKTNSDRDLRIAIRKLADRNRPTDRWIIANAVEKNGEGYREIYGGKTIANLEYYFRLWLPTTTIWRAKPENIESGAGNVHLVILRNADHPLPEDIERRFVEALDSRFGSVRKHRFLIGHAERLDVLEFSAAKLSWRDRNP